MITDPAIEQYILDLLPARDDVLAEMETYAAEHRVPIIGPAVATAMSLLVRLSGAKRIFELGSAIGYSTIWLARAAGEGAEVHYSDGGRENAGRAQGYFQRAGVADQVRVHVGDALMALGDTSGEFDFIFNDVDKEGYPDVLRAAASRLRKGGLFVTDNTLWHGRVLDPRDEASRGVVEFNAKLFASNQFLTSLLPIRDGLSVSLRL